MDTKPIGRFTLDTKNGQMTNQIIAFECDYFLSWVTNQVLYNFIQPMNLLVYILYSVRRTRSSVGSYKLIPFGTDRSGACDTGRSRSAVRAGFHGGYR